MYQCIGQISMVTMTIPKTCKYGGITTLDVFDHPVLHLQVNSRLDPITHTPARASVTPQARSAVGPPSKDTPTPGPLAEPSATPLAAPQATTLEATPTPSMAGTPPFSTPPPRRTPPQVSLGSEHQQRRSASAKKPPLHPPASPGPALTPPAQAGSAAKLSSAATSTQTPPGHRLPTPTLLSLHNTADSNSCHCPPGSQLSLQRITATSLLKIPYPGPWIHAIVFSVDLTTRAESMCLRSEHVSFLSAVFSSLSLGCVVLCYV